MKKIERVFESCWRCRHCYRYVSVSDEYIGEVRLCGHRDLCNRSDRDRLIQVVDDDSKEVPIPDWCPLETYKEDEKSEAALTESTEAELAEVADEKTPSTIILPGLPNLEWMIENLSGYGGTEIDGNTYYTYDEAVAAVEQLGNGWRLPTPEEQEALCGLGSTWDEERKGRWFGGNHDTDHEGSLFLPAAGYSASGSGALTNVSTEGLYWSSSYAAGTIHAGRLTFNSGIVGPLYGYRRAVGFSVRCVRNVK